MRVFIDGDNISPKTVNNFFEFLNKESYLTIQQDNFLIYFAESFFENMGKKWEKVLNERPLKTIFCKEYKQGKNSTDIKMVVDIMSYIYEKKQDVLIISGDTDFISVLEHLRELNVKTFTFIDQHLQYSSLYDNFNIILKSKELGGNLPHFKNIGFLNLLKMLKSDLKQYGKYYRADDIQRFAANYVRGFNYKKLGFKKFKDYILSLEHILEIKEVKEKNSSYFLICPKSN